MGPTTGKQGMLFVSQKAEKWVQRFLDAFFVAGISMLSKYVSVWASEGDWSETERGGGAVSSGWEGRGGGRRTVCSFSLVGELSFCVCDDFERFLD